MRIAIELTDQERKRLAEIAERLDVSVETLATAAVREIAATPDEAFERVASRLLDKNRELYERLS